MGKQPASIPTTYAGQAWPDVFSVQPFAAGFEARRAAFFEQVQCNPAPPRGSKRIYFEVARLAAGGSPDETIIHEALSDYIEARQDCADFVMHGALRLLYQFPAGFSRQLLDNARKAVLSFKYWPDDLGSDGSEGDSMCSWTENHQILFASAAHLAGQLYPDEVFSNSGRTGYQLMAIYRPRIDRWLDLRFKTGFSEWLSNVYYDKDLASLLNLVDFATDAELRRRASMILDLLLFDMAANSFQGVFGSTHGRSYEPRKKWAALEGTTDIAKLLFGLGAFSAYDNMAAPLFAMSENYRPPAVIYEIAHDTATLENRQRMGIRVDEAERWGLSYDDLEDGMVFLSLEAYLHPRTADYMLSSAVDYRPGYGGDQQHIWQATLGPDAVCFTTHPPRRDGLSPNYWTGSGTLPRVAQSKNVVIAIYRISALPGLYVTNKLFYTHAWLPRDRFDEVLEVPDVGGNGWVFARKGEGYLALRSQQSYRWQTQEGEDQHREIVAGGKHNIWLCELGSQAQSGSFEDFVAAICAAPLTFNGLTVSYRSPAQGNLEFGWKGPFRQNGQVVCLENFPRYGSPYAQVDFGAQRVEIRHGEHRLLLDWEKGERYAL